jgi:Fe-S-cluster-containing hydrogenase component 2
LRIAGTVAIGVGAGGYAGVKKALPTIVKLADGRSGIPVSGGYLLVDVKKCQGCMSCMLACSLVNEGVENLSLSRIQVIQNSFDKWPHDLTIEQCRQCVDPACVTACPEDALTADARFGNVRRVVDVEKCTGCGACIEECSYTPSRPFVVPDEAYGDELKARKCGAQTGRRFGLQSQSKGFDLVYFRISAVLNGGEQSLLMRRWRLKVRLHLLYPRKNESLWAYIGM